MSEVNSELRAKFGKIVARLPKMDFFQILNVTADATDMDIKKAFRKRSMNFHPDRFYGGDEEIRDLANTIYKNVATAYNAIKRPNLRKAYLNALEIDRENNLRYNPLKMQADALDPTKEKLTGPGAKYYELALASYTAQDKRSAMNNIRLAESMDADNALFKALREKIESLT